MLTLNRAAVKQLGETGHFSYMSISTDEDEHSIEMHLPYVRKVFQGFVSLFFIRMTINDNSFLEKI